MRLLQATVHLQNGKPRRNQQILRRVQPSKTETGSNILKKDKTNHNYNY